MIWNFPVPINKTIGCILFQIIIKFPNLLKWNHNWNEQRRKKKRCTQLFCAQKSSWYAWMCVIESFDGNRWNLNTQKAIVYSAELRKFNKSNYFNEMGQTFLQWV